METRLNSSNVNSCKNDNDIKIDNASSIIDNIACNIIPNYVPTNVSDNMDMSNVNDNMGNLNNDNDGFITSDDASPPLGSNVSLSSRIALILELHF